MYKTTHKNKNHFTNLCTLTLIALFISAFTEVNAQSSSKTTTGTAPAAVLPTDAAAPQGSLQVAPAHEPAEAMVDELITEQSDPATSAAKSAAVQLQIEPAALPNQVKKQADKKQPK